MTWAKILNVLRWQHNRLAPFFRAQLEAELSDIITRYMNPINGLGPP